MSEPLHAEASLWRGGRAHRLGRRLGLTREGGGDDPLRQSVLFAVVAWLPQLVVGSVEAVRHDAVDSALWWSVLEGAVRWLVAVPLLCMGMRAVAFEIDRALHHLVATNTVPADEVASLTRLNRRLVRLRDGWVAELVLLALAWTLGGVAMQAFSITPAFQGVAASWGLWVALPLFRFLILRWLWQWALWSVMLWRVSRVRLQLQCSHPDRAAGLSFLVRPSRWSAPIVLGLSAVLAGTWAAQMAADALHLTQLIGIAAFYIVLLLGVLLTPTLALLRPIRHAIVDQHHDYDALIRAQSQAFDARWLADTRPVEPGSAEFSGLADLGAVIERVHATKFVPFTSRDVAVLTGAALVPLAPLLLFEIPLDSLLRRLVEAVV